MSWPFISLSIFLSCAYEQSDEALELVQMLQGRLETGGDPAPEPAPAPAPAAEPTAADAQTASTESTSASTDQVADATIADASSTTASEAASDSSSSSSSSSSSGSLRGSLASPHMMRKASQSAAVSESDDGGGSVNMFDRIRKQLRARRS